MDKSLSNRLYQLTAKQYVYLNEFIKTKLVLFSKKTSFEIKLWFLASNLAYSRYFIDYLINHADKVINDTKYPKPIEDSSSILKSIPSADF